MLFPYLLSSHTKSKLCHWAFQANSWDSSILKSINFRKWSMEWVCCESNYTTKISFWLNDLIISLMPTWYATIRVTVGEKNYSPGKYLHTHKKKVLINVPESDYDPWYTPELVQTHSSYSPMDHIKLGGSVTQWWHHWYTCPSVITRGVHVA